MMVKHLFINGGSVLTVKKDSEGNFEYYTVTADGLAMQKVDYLQFADTMKAYAHICLVSHNPKLAQEYKELYYFISDL